MWKSAEIQLKADWSYYKITNPSGAVYIGMSKNILKRVNHYKRGDCKNQTKLYYSINKYGWDSHSFEIIDTLNGNLSEGMSKEKFWIRTYMSNYSKYPEMNGLNLTNGGRSNLGRIVSEETKQKLRDANLGKKYSEETKKKLSELRKGRKINRVWSEEERKKMSELKKGFKHTEEAKKKIGEASIGNKHSLGTKHTDEWKQMMKKVMTGNKYRLGTKNQTEFIN